MESNDGETSRLLATAAAGSAWLVAAVVLHGFAYFFLMAPWMGEDEPWHLEYARNLALRGADSIDEPAVEGLSLSQRRI